MSFNVRRGAGASVRGGGDGARRPFDEMTRSYIGGVSLFEGVKERMCGVITSSM